MQKRFESSQKSLYPSVFCVEADKHEKIIEMSLMEFVEGGNSTPFYQWISRWVDFREEVRPFTSFSASSD